MTGTDLKQRLQQRIRLHGPITVADYMATCLGDAEHGYYTRQEPFGADGDFITAPEVSQMFGELIGAFLLQAYERMGSPDAFNLVELGPGRGTLMVDILRVARLRPAFMRAVSVTLVEMSPRLREKQKTALENAGVEPVFADTFQDIEKRPTLLVANEFFDALPIHQFTRTAEGWLERVIGLDEAGELAFGIGNGRLPDDAVPPAARSAELGSILETQPAANAIAEDIGAFIADQGGTALAIDYGYLKSAAGDTLQALYRHAFDDVLARPGQADLTAHVNFEALAAAASRGGAVTFPVLEQGEFLLRMGLLERAGALGAGKTPDQQETIRDQVERLAAPDQMGQLFKVLAISNSGSPLAPFDPIRDT